MIYEVIQFEHLKWFQLLNLKWHDKDTPRKISSGDDYYLNSNGIRLNSIQKIYLYTCFRFSLNSVKLNNKYTHTIQTEWIYIWWIAIIIIIITMNFIVEMDKTNIFSLFCINRMNENCDCDLYQISYTYTFSIMCKSIISHIL